MSRPGTSLACALLALGNLALYGAILTNHPLADTYFESYGYVPGTPDETGGRGKWRIEVSPAVPAKDDVFLHVLCPRLGHEGAFPAIERINGEETRTTAGPNRSFDGALIREGDKQAAVFFSHGERRQSAFSALLPAHRKTSVIVVSLRATTTSPRPKVIRIGFRWDSTVFCSSLVRPAACSSPRDSLSSRVLRGGQFAKQSFS